MRGALAEYIKISIHALREEGDEAFRQDNANFKHFYPRPPRGGRPIATGRLTVHSRFLSTPSARRATSTSKVNRSVN